VEVAFGEATIELTVTNPVQALTNRDSRSLGGHGLIGMRERATLLGGSFAVDGSDDMFRISARIPYAGDGV
jgi:signal transduction histidine kinase